MFETISLSLSLSPTLIKTQSLGLMINDGQLRFYLSLPLYLLHFLPILPFLSPSLLSLTSLSPLQVDLPPSLPLYLTFPPYPIFIPTSLPLSFSISLYYFFSPTNLHFLDHYLSLSPSLSPSLGLSLLPSLPLYFSILVSLPTSIPMFQVSHLYISPLSRFFPPSPPISLPPYPSSPPCELLPPPHLSTFPLSRSLGHSLSTYPSILSPLFITLHSSLSPLRSPSPLQVITSLSHPFVGLSLPPCVSLPIPCYSSLFVLLSLLFTLPPLPFFLSWALYLFRSILKPPSLSPPPFSNHHLTSLPIGLSPLLPSISYFPRFLTPSTFTSPSISSYSSLSLRDPTILVYNSIEEGKLQNPSHEKKLVFQGLHELGCSYVPQFE